MTDLEKLIALVRHLRNTQRACTRTCSDQALREAHEAERRMDAYLSALDRGRDLFDPEGRP